MEDGNEVSEANGITQFAEGEPIWSASPLGAALSNAPLKPMPQP